MVRLEVIDWAPAAWFLMTSSENDLLLEVRYSHGAVLDASALIRLDAAEVSRWRRRGAAAIHDLARQVSDGYLTPRSEPQEHSVWWERDLYRTDTAGEWRAAAWEAIQAWPAWVRWRAEQ